MKDLRNKLFFKNGFTLIELLVAITIIGLLATVVTMSAAKALERNRDLKRQALINETADALEKYYYDQRQYPATAGYRWKRDFVNPGVNFGQNDPFNPIIPNLVPAYISSLPKDPKFDPNTEIRGFMYSSDARNYKLVSYNNVESVTKISTTDSLYDQSLIRWDCLMAKSYSIFSPGGTDLYWGSQSSVICP